MSELASVAKVSVGQIYRLFAGKNDIIAAIVEDDSMLRLDQWRRAAEGAEHGSVSIEEAFRELIRHTLDGGEDALSFEILAEAYRNPGIARKISELCDLYRLALRRLVCVANPDLGEKQIEAAQEMLLACLFGLGHRALSRPRLPADETAEQVSRMILIALRGMVPAAQSVA